MRGGPGPLGNHPRQLDTLRDGCETGPDFGCFTLGRIERKLLVRKGGLEPPRPCRHKNPNLMFTKIKLNTCLIDDRTTALLRVRVSILNNVPEKRSKRHVTRVA